MPVPHRHALRLKPQHTTQSITRRLLRTISCGHRPDRHLSIEWRNVAVIGTIMSAQAPAMSNLSPSLQTSLSACCSGPQFHVTNTHLSSCSSLADIYSPGSSPTAQHGWTCQGMMPVAPATTSNRHYNLSASLSTTSSDPWSIEDRGTERALSEHGRHDDDRPDRATASTTCWTRWNKCCTCLHEGHTARAGVLRASRCGRTAAKLCCL